MRSKYFEEIIPSLGVSRREIYRQLLIDGTPQRCIDAYMMGLDRSLQIRKAEEE